VGQLHCSRCALCRISCRISCRIFCRIPLLALAPAGVVEEEEGAVNGENTRDERPDKDLADISPAPSKDGERKERAGSGAKRVGAAVKTKCLASMLGCNGVGDNGVTRSAANGLASAVKQDQAKSDGPARDKCQERLA